MRKKFCPTCGHDLDGFAELYCVECETCSDYHDYMAALVEEQQDLRDRGVL